MTVSKSRARAGLRTGRVTASQALRVARSFGVTLDLSNDLELAGKWKHGWIPLDAVAAAVKAKRYHGGGGEGRMVRGKARSGSLVESMRRPSGGRNKINAGLPERSTGGVSEAARRANDQAKARVDSVIDGDAARHYAKTGVTHVASRSGSVHEVAKIEGGLVHTKDGRIFRASTVTTQTRGQQRRIQDELPARGRAVKRQISATRRTGEKLAERARERNATRPQPKVSKLGDAELQHVVTMYGTHSVQGKAARAEMERRVGPANNATRSMVSQPTAADRSKLFEKLEARVGRKKAEEVAAAQGFARTPGGTYREKARK